MINVGLALILAATSLGIVGVVGCVAARRSASRSRCTALAIFGHGSLASSGLLFAAMAFHIHGFSPFELHVHPADLALAQLLACDLEVGCALITIGLLTVLVFAAAFAISQASGRVLLHRLRRLVLPEATARLRDLTSDPRGVKLLAVREAAPDAFSFAILRGDPRRVAKAVSVVVVTQGMIDLLDEAELTAVVAHELSHVRARDDRYLPFFRTLSRLLFFDPVLHRLHRRASRLHEFEADRESARTTKRPRDLARALLKLYLHVWPEAEAVSIYGGSRSELLARIEALIALETTLNDASASPGAA